MSFSAFGLKRPGLVVVVALLAATPVVGCSPSNDQPAAPVQPPAGEQPPQPAEQTQDENETQNQELKETLDRQFADYLDARAKATDLDHYEGNTLIGRYATPQEVIQSSIVSSTYRNEQQLLISLGEFTSHLAESEIGKDHARLFACMDFTSAKVISKVTGNAIKVEPGVGAWDINFKLIKHSWLIDSITFESKEAAEKCGL